MLHPRRRLLFLVLFCVSSVSIVWHSSVLFGLNVYGYNNNNNDALSVSSNGHDYYTEPITTANDDSSHDRHTNYSPRPSVSVEAEDYIYKKTQGWDTSPIVIQKFKLIFFQVPKVACTTWKQLFRRIEGFENWNLQTGQPEALPHNPKTNGLVYLWDLSTKEATDLMTRPDYTRAIFVREPKARILSAFLDKTRPGERFIRDKCCRHTSNNNTNNNNTNNNTRDCSEDAKTLGGFLNLTTWCFNPHWRPQHHRMDEKFWPYIDFIGHFETVEEDAKTLLKRVGAWEGYGDSQWGKDGNLSIFQRNSNTQNHKTGASTQVAEHFQSPGLLEQFERIYGMEYEGGLLGYNKSSSE